MTGANDPIETLWGEVDSCPVEEPEEPLCESCGACTVDYVGLCQVCLMAQYGDPDEEEEASHA